MKRSIDAEADDLLQAVGLLVRRVRAVAESHELSLSESSVLKYLATNGPATTADLARAEKVKPQSMGATVGALEERGLIDRQPHPTDGRQMLIHLTREGVALRENRKSAKRTWAAQAVARLSKEDREMLWRAVHVMRRLAEE